LCLLVESPRAALVKLCSHGRDGTQKAEIELIKELRKRLAEQLPGGQRIKGPIKIGAIQSAGPNSDRAWVGFETEPDV